MIVRQASSREKDNSILSCEWPNIRYIHNQSSHKLVSRSKCLRWTNKKQSFVIICAVLYLVIFWTGFFIAQLSLEWGLSCCSLLIVIVIITTRQVGGILSDGHLPLVRGHRQSGVRLQGSPNTERCLPSLGDHCLFYAIVVLPDLALLFLRSELSLIDQGLLGIWTAAFFTTCLGDCIHGPGIPWFVACLFPVVNFPP